MNFQKHLTALAVLFCAATASAVDLGTPTASTPYEAYMRPVKQVLSSLPGQTASMDRVQKLMREGRSFRYSFTEPYLATLPAVTAKTKIGDCKAKSLWLADQMGDRSVRYVIGKARRTSKISHAWIMWNDGSKWWVLDCTNTSRPIAADSLSRDQYIPLYSYDSRRCYRHSATQIFTAGTTVANAPVASERLDR